MDEQFGHPADGAWLRDRRTLWSRNQFEIQIQMRPGPDRARRCLARGCFNKPFWLYSLPVNPADVSRGPFFYDSRKSGLSDYADILASARHCVRSVGYFSNSLHYFDSTYEGSGRLYAAWVAGFSRFTRFSRLPTAKEEEDQTSSHLAHIFSILLTIIFIMKPE